MHYCKKNALIQYSFNVQNRPMDSNATDLEIFSYSFKFHMKPNTCVVLVLYQKMSSHNYLKMLFKILPLPIFV